MGRGVSKEMTGRVGRRGAWKGRRVFVVLVVVPVLLMLGSVYVHNVAAGLKGETARLEEEKARAESEGERLDVRITELSEPQRIRAMARKQLQMRDPGGKELETYGRDGEDVANGGGEKKKETGQ
ncbi:MAG: cell division protein FtsL [Actinomycetota bacterium]|nr:cell division protein FtsL [Actinomycetota bacterium]